VSHADVCSLVDCPLAPTNPHLDLGLAVLEVDAHGDEGETLFGQGSSDPIDFAPMEEELAAALRVVATFPGIGVGSDVSIDQPHLPIPDVPEAVLQVSLSGAETLHLGTVQNQPSLEVVDDLVVVAGTAVGSYDLDVAHRAAQPT